ncbi:hypothetical protein THAOC_07314 [Thalassiosira oceanica]|uniref:Uncharacterized protein n=1 Tax=Thalassiosira oceanica TaxID=159749 RepID=K0SXW9_THAOC|nr:hypothetical protein THAOC_07314 [Thalassiosira oceanica]|eukprot:EJK71268.1 hypothetical protein THAOC_07314 [Thalassiosira oceanica]
MVSVAAGATTDGVEGGARMKKQRQRRRGRGPQKRHALFQQRKNNIVPDLLTRNHPTGGSLREDSGSRPASAAAFFEVKTLLGNLSNYVDAENQADPDTRRASGRNAGAGFDGLTSDLRPTRQVSDGKASRPPPFSQAGGAKWFLMAGVIPLVVGVFGESNTGLLKLLKTWARHAGLGRPRSGQPPPHWSTRTERGAHSPSCTNNSYGRWLGSGPRQATRPSN